MSVTEPPVQNVVGPDALIVGALVGLGKALGLEVTAEGVEDEATAEALRAMGCHLAQGYLFGAAIEFPRYGDMDVRATA